MEQPQILGTDINTLIQQQGGLDKAKSYLDLLIRKGELQFPFHNTYIDPPEVMLQRLREFKVQPVWDRYKLSSYFPRSEPKLYLPPTFRGHSVYLIGLEKDYLETDLLSDHFVEDVRIRTKRKDSPSVSDYWVYPELRSKFLDQLLTKGILDNRTMRDIFYELTYESKQFRPTWVKGLYQVVGIPNGAKVLDISAGWGDRLISAIANDNQYLGFDPNEELKPGHDLIISSLGNPTKQKIIYKPFEEATVEELGNGYDAILSSPPFFDLELYPGGPNQSANKFPEVNAWLKGFLFPSLQKAWSVLKQGGYLIIHLGDTKELKISEPMNLFIESYLPNASYEGIIGLAGEYEGKIGPVRPVWIWRKGGPNIKINVWKPNIRRSLRQLYPELGL